MLAYPLTDQVRRVARCELHLGGASWSYATDHAAAIEAGWRTATLAHPQYFNGVVHLIDKVQFSADVLRARVLRTDFKSYLYWRTAGFPQTGVRDGFGSALIRAGDGAILLGRQRQGNVNGGLTYLPGGFIDARDVDADGQIDISSSVSRELHEETGLGRGDVEIVPGFLVTETGAHVSIAKTFRSNHDADALKAQMMQHLASDPASELDDIAIVRRAADLDGLAMPRYAQILAGWVLANECSGD